MMPFNTKAEQTHFPLV